MIQLTLPFYDPDPKNLQIIVNKGFCNIDLTAAYVNAFSSSWDIPHTERNEPSTRRRHGLVPVGGFSCHSSALGDPETLITPDGQK